MITLHLSIFLTILIILAIFSFYTGIMIGLSHTRQEDENDQLGEMVPEDYNRLAKLNYISSKTASEIGNTIKAELEYMKNIHAGIIVKDYEIQKMIKEQNVSRKLAIQKIIFEQVEK